MTTTTASRRNLATSYLGFTLKNPLVASAGPMTDSMDRLRMLEEAGIAAVVLPSLFEEQLQQESESLDASLSQGADSHREARGYFPELPDYNLGPDDYLEHIRRAKAAVKVPVIASLNGTTPGGWVKYAKLMQEAGADALELNIYSIETNPNISSAEVERRYAELVAQVKRSVKLPLAVKLSPYFSAPANFAMALSRAGADALVLFNRFYQPEFDLEHLDVVPSLHLSTSRELNLRLHWTAILFGQVPAEIAITGGIHTGEDAIKAMMAGARVACMTSALLHHGAGHIRTVLEEMVRWMDEHEYWSVQEMQGSMSQRRVANPAAFERANYMKVLGVYAMRWLP